jgi:biopolymer transport protein ExbB
MIAIMRAMAFTGGNWVIYILIVCSVLTIAVIVERALVLSRERKESSLVKEIFGKSLAEGTGSISEYLKGSSAFSARVLKAGLAKIHEGIYVVEETMSHASNEERKRLEARMIILNTLGNNAVYIGLFGTVLGVIKAFHDLSLQGGGGAEVVMQGLSEALIATATGLLVAIPCVVAYNIFQKQIREILSDSETMSKLLLAKLKSSKV